MIVVIIGVVIIIMDIVIVDIVVVCTDVGGLKAPMVQGGFFRTLKFLLIDAFICDIIIIIFVVIIVVVVVVFFGTKDTSDGSPTNTIRSVSSC